MNYRLMSAFLATNEPADAFRRTPHELGLKGNLNRDPRNIAARARIYAWLAAPPRRRAAARSTRYRRYAT